MQLGVVPEPERTPDSPDTVLHVEPRVGAQTRTKGHLYLVVTSRVPGPRAGEATFLVADAIRSEYYYDESAGIRVCLTKAIQAANKRLTHARERGALGSASGPIGVGIAVVRDNELYVCTVGPAEAYLNRGARLSTLPDPHRDRGLPAADVDPDVWRGEINVGDQLMLISPNVTAALGPDALNDALVQLHPQSAAEQLGRLFSGGGGRGSDGILVIEAAEISVARAGFAPVPVRPAEPLAGAPDRSPIPLADSVAGGFAAAQSAGRWARLAAGTALGRLLLRAQDALPVRRVPSRRVTPLSTRREMQRRAAVAVLALVVVVGGLGAAVFALGGRQPADEVISSIDAGQQALEQARADYRRVIGPGVDLVETDPRRAEDLLTDALEQVDKARSSGIPVATTGPLQAQIIAALDRLFGVIEVDSSTVFQFPGEPAVRLQALVRGPDGAPFVLDALTATVYRIDVAGETATAVFREGAKAAGATQATPRLIAVGARDLLMVDAKNVVWRWRPANTEGKGTIRRVPVVGATEWGDDVIGIGTFVRNAEAGLYNLYVIDPSAEQILRYSPAADGSGFPAAPTSWLAAARDVSAFRSLFIDGDVWVVDDGRVLRFVNGQSEGWAVDSPGDEILRPPPQYRLISSGSPRREGVLYAFDLESERVVAFNKANGTYLEQYRLVGGSADWAGLVDWYVEAGVADDPDTLVWMSATALHRVTLEPLTTAPGASPGASSGGSADASPGGSEAAVPATPAP
jgi:hypothetical protein